MDQKKIMVSCSERGIYSLCHLLISSALVVLSCVGCLWISGVYMSFFKQEIIIEKAVFQYMYIVFVL